MRHSALLPLAFMLLVIPVPTFAGEAQTPEVRRTPVQDLRDAPNARKDLRRGPISEDEGDELVRGLGPADRIGPGLDTVRSQFADLQSALEGPAPAPRRLHTIAVGAKDTLGELIGLARQLEPGLGRAENAVGGTGASQDLGMLREAFERLLKELDAQDKRENSEMQVLMTRFRQAENLASSVQKKSDDTKSTILQKVG